MSLKEDIAKLIDSTFGQALSGLSGLNAVPRWQLIKVVAMQDFEARCALYGEQDSAAALLEIAKVLHASNTQDIFTRVLDEMLYLLAEGEIKGGELTAAPIEQWMQYLTTLADARHLWGSTWQAADPATAAALLGPMPSLAAIFRACKKA